MIEIEALWSGYGGVEILRGVELSVNEGEVGCIIGPNGAGKSTVLKTISGLLAPRRGRIVAAGSDLTGRTPVAIIRAGVVQVPQRGGLFTGLTVRQNVLMGGYVMRHQRR
jgi:branched-chain amino acid transport system ATP-binding protein